MMCGGQLISQSLKTFQWIVFCAAIRFNTILSIHKSASFMQTMTRTFALLTVKHCEQIKRVVVGYSLIVVLT